MRTVFGLLIFKMTGGHIDHAGYYRLNIAGEHTIVPAAAEAGAL